jgi:hypothetical protein
VFVATAEDGPVTIGMNLDQTGVIRSEFEERVAFAAHRKEDAILLQFLDHALDFCARNVWICKSLVDFSDAEKAVAALPQQLDDSRMQLGLCGC